MKSLDALTFPLGENALIEASAGTGKTYTISNLYIRLVLGHQCKPLSVAQILILTFTNAATAELKERILARIQEALLEFTRGTSDDKFIAGLLADIADHQAAAQRLRIAVQEMDMASVFTIHGFCQRVLTEHAFESGGEWQHTMLLDDYELIDTAVKDYWRKVVARLSFGELQEFLAFWSVPESLVKTLRPVIFRDIGNESPEKLKQIYLSARQEYQRTLQETQHWWRESKVSQMLADADLKANVKLAKPDFWAMMNDFVQSESPQYFAEKLGKEGWMTLSPEKVEKARKKSSSALPIDEFERFVLLDKLLNQSHKLLQQAFFWDALVFVRQHLAKAKASRTQLAPDDLLQNLRYALKQDAEGHLTSAIKSQYPVTLIDEFQDTDEVQFAIFRAVYLSENRDENPGLASTLILIGDPKQAIYSFRGGDIYTYLQAKHLIQAESLYTLDTNWRSNPELVRSVNRLFEKSASGFMNDDMPFHQVAAGRSDKQVTDLNGTLDSLKFTILPSKSNTKGILEPLKWSDSSELMSQRCASEVARYLQQVKVEGKSIAAGDICILVRDRFEAELIQTALRNYHIDSVFLLKETVFKSPVAYSLYLLLKAIMDYRSEATIKAALLDWMMCNSDFQLQELLQETAGWQQVLNHFCNANQLLHNKSVMTALDYLLAQFDVFAKIARNYQDSDRIITDVRHLSEILQKQSAKMEGHAALIKWFAQRVANPDLIKADNIEDIQWRLETDQNLVQITTIHASKGLQYPFVFIPFVSRYKANDSGFYHNEEQLLQYDLAADETIALQIDSERLAEDIRLFYVAVTRAVYHCWLGVWDNNGAGRKVQSGFLLTAFGKLISAPDMIVCDHQAISQRLKELLQGTSVDITIAEDDIQAEHQHINTVADVAPDYAAATLDKPIEQSWFLTSYSAISRQRVMPEITDLHADENYKAEDESAIVEDLDSSFTQEETAQALAMRFRFAKGAEPGSYLHEVLEVADFNNKSDLLEQCQKYSDKFSIEESHIPEVVDWLWEVLATPINEHCLQDLSATQRLPEMEFWLPLHQVDIKAFNLLVQTWLPELEGEYRLQTLHGMLKGFLDLVYCHNDKFYVADYKSNYLGDDFSDYYVEQLHQAMLHHDYYLQALLYSLALHRYLKLKLPDYSYDTYIGGAQYLFLRGMSPHSPQSGVLHVRPPESVILALDDLFSEHIQEVDA